MHALSAIRTRDHRNRAAVDLSPRQHGSQDFRMTSLVATGWQTPVRFWICTEIHYKILVNLPSAVVILLCYVDRYVATGFKYWWSLSGR